MFRKLILASCLSVFVLSLAACEPAEIRTTPTADQDIPGDPNLDADDPRSGVDTSPH